MEEMGAIFIRETMGHSERRSIARWKLVKPNKKNKCISGNRSKLIR